mgnify:CR=1 FL=1
MIELRQPTFFKSAVESISSFIPEGNFRFSDKGIYFRAIDPSQVVLVDYFVDKKYFDKYVVEPNFVGLDLVELNKILARSLPNDKLLIDVGDSDLKIKFESDLRRSFKLPLIDVSADEAKLPSIDYEAKIEINSQHLKELLKDASLFSTSVVFRASDGKFFVEAKGTGGVLESEATRVSKVFVKKEIVSKFSLNFLQNIVRHAESDKQIMLELKNDSAMHISYFLGPAKISYYLAHMIL